ncbi:MAG: hypothetical protein LBU36_07890 [Clostridiales bacterium]|jgi:hypothetical protein|nr:hypothetical protein [Clostridiales bacterium]
MKKAVITGFIIAAALFSSILAAAGGELDVVGADSARAFGEVLGAAAPYETATCWGIGGSEALGGSARFLWNGGAAYVQVSAEPFLEAGLDPEKFEVYGGVIVFGRDFSKGQGIKQKINIKKDPLADYSNIVKTSPDSINYHAALDHYGVKLGGGNMFEWARDMAGNDKDVVFVLNPEPLISAGADPEKVKGGWVYTQVPVEENGRTELVWKFLQAYDLE